MTTLDHLVYGVASLEAGADSLAGSFGIRATAGGKHLGRGTHNALISLGNVWYLKLIAPDPEQELPALGLPFGLERLRKPRLVGWAIGIEHIDELVERARARGYDPGAIESMERVRPDGIRLLTRPPSSFVVPYRGKKAVEIKLLARRHGGGRRGRGGSGSPR